MIAASVVVDSETPIETIADPGICGVKIGGEDWVSILSWDSFALRRAALALNEAADRLDLAAVAERAS